MNQETAELKQYVTWPQLIASGALIAFVSVLLSAAVTWVVPNTIVAEAKTKADSAKRYADNAKEYMEAAQKAEDKFQGKFQEIDQLNQTSVQIEGQLATVQRGLRQSYVLVGINRDVNDEPRCPDGWRYEGHLLTLANAELFRKAGVPAFLPGGHYPGQHPDLCKLN